MRDASDLAAFAARIGDPANYQSNDDAPFALVGGSLFPAP